MSADKMTQELELAEHQLHAKHARDRSDDTRFALRHAAGFPGGVYGTSYGVSAYGGVGGQVSGVQTPLQPGQFDSDHDGDVDTPGTPDIDSNGATMSGGMSAGAGGSTGGTGQ